MGKIAYKIFSFLFKKFSVLKNSAAKALMKDLTNLSILNSIQKFHNCSIVDIMTPRTEIYALDVNLSKIEVLKKIKGSCYTKVLLYKGNFDNVIGFFYVKDVLLNQDTDFNLKHIMQTILYVPPSMKTTTLFAKMKSSKLCLAVVIDEYGGTDGLISITDLIKEMLPSFDNEHEENYIIKLPQNKFEVSARILIKDIEEDLHIELRDPEEDYVTLGGLILSVAGKIPSTDEVIEYKDGIKFIIKESNERYISTIILDLSNHNSKD